MDGRPSPERPPHSRAWNSDVKRYFPVDAVIFPWYGMCGVSSQWEATVHDIALWGVRSIFALLALGTVYLIARALWQQMRNERDPHDEFRNERNG